MDSSTFSKENITLRMLKRAAELWGFQENDTDGFDPLVKLLIEAMSGELEKIGNEINATQSRVLERWTNIIDPGIDNSSPAYGVVQARSVDAFTILHPEQGLVVKKAGTKTPGGTAQENGELFFSATKSTKVFNGSVKFLYACGSLSIVENGIQKTTVLHQNNSNALAAKNLWLGIELDEDVTSIKDLSFYFDWHNELSKEVCYQLLGMAEWHLEHTILATESGSGKSRKYGFADNPDLFWDVSYKMETLVEGIFDKCFVAIKTAATFKELKYERKLYPAEFEKIFSLPELKVFKQKLVWINIRFPESIPSESLKNTFCAINCFPVLNRRLYKKTYRLQQMMNIVPLESSDSFFSVKEVTSTQNEPFKAVSLSAASEMSAQSYVLRYGLNRMDQRDSRQLLEYLLEILQDESASFASIGEEFLSSQIRDLNQIIARLEQKMTNSFRSSPHPYLVVRSGNPGETIFIEYWSTAGAYANNIPAGTRPTLFSGAQLDKNNLFFMTATFGGKHKPGSQDKINQFKTTLLSRNKIITAADIQAVCKVETGNEAREIVVKKIFEPEQIPSRGFVRKILVSILRSEGSSLKEEEWNQLAKKLEVILQENSSGLLPFKVEII